MHYDYHVSISNHGFKILFYDINKFIFYIYFIYITYIPRRYIETGAESKAFQKRKQEIKKQS